MKCQGMLADVNVQGHLQFIRGRLAKLGLLPVLVESGIQLKTFPELHINPDIDDRSLWNLCQREGWVLFTEDRNDEGRDSLQSTLADSHQMASLPVLTISSKQMFEHHAGYRDRVAKSIAEVLFGLQQGEYLGSSRIYVPISGNR
jgi:hypothetical protein